MIEEAGRPSRQGAGEGGASKARRRPLRLRRLFWLALLLPAWWALRQVPLAEAWAILRGVRAEAALALAVLNLAILASFAMRWWLILGALGFRRPYLPLAGYRLAAFGVTYFTPGPQLGGEPLQVYLLQRRQGVPAASALASVALDKLFELLANFTFLLLGVGTLLLSGFVAGPARIPALPAALALLALPAGAALALRAGSRPLSRLLSRLASLLPAWAFLPRASRALACAEQQAGEFLQRQPRAILQALALSALTWAALLLEFRLALQALGAPLSLPQAVAALTAARLAFLLPIPAGVGALEAGQVLAMQAFGVNPAFGVSLSLLIRARDFAFGGLGLWLGGWLTR